MENIQQPNAVVSLKKQNFGLIVMLVLELVLGVSIGIFTKFPETGTKEEFWSYAMSQPIIIAHIILAMLLLIAAAVFAWKAHKSAIPFWFKVSVLGLIALLAADGFGSRFIGTQSDIFSYLMSFGFVVAFVTYGYAWYRSK